MFGLDDFLSIGKMVINSLVKLVVSELKVLANAFVELGKELGLINKDTDIEDLGNKALQAEEQGKKPEDFDSFESFVNSLDDINLDQEKSKNLSAEDKLKKGIEVVTSLVAEKYEGLDMENFVNCAVDNVSYFTPERIKEFGKLIQSDVETVNNLMKYFNGTELNDAKLEKDESILVDIEKTINPSISDDDALRTVRMAQK